MNTIQNMRCDGDINVSRVVVAATDNPNSCSQASAGTPRPLGISWDRSKLDPNPNYTAAQLLIAGNAGDPIGIWSEGAVGVPLYCNYAWNPGDLLMSDASGYGIQVTSGNYYVARAQTAGVVGSYCSVDVVIGFTSGQGSGG